MGDNKYSSQAWFEEFADHLQQLAREAGVQAFTLCAIAPTGDDKFQVASRGFLSFSQGEDVIAIRCIEVMAEALDRALDDLAESKSPPEGNDLEAVLEPVSEGPTTSSTFKSSTKRWIH